MKRIVMISSGQPSFNPRLVKEANASAGTGDDVTVVYSYWNQTAAELDVQLFKEVKWLPVLAGGTPGELRFLYTRLKHKLFNILAKRIGYLPGISEMAKGRAYSELLTTARSIKADMYIGHNLAALPVAVKAAKYNNAKAGFDAEDFHRHEVTDDTSAPEYKLAKYIEDKYLPVADYRTAASPQIANAYKAIYPEIDFTTINNVFSRSYQPRQFIASTGPLKLFWFSQTIGKNRGLEQVWQALGRLNDLDIQLTLAGNCSAEMHTYLGALTLQYNIGKEKIKIVAPLPERDLFELAAAQDIGLALEQTVPYNRDICLTNKIFSYLVSGLAVIATNTQAQQAFINQYPSVGKSFAIGNIDQLEQILRSYYNDRVALNAARQAAYELAGHELNWEVEQKKFLKLVEEVI